MEKVQRLLDSLAAREQNLNDVLCELAEKQKAEKAKTIKNRNLERAKKLGIEFLKENMPY